MKGMEMHLKKGRELAQKLITQDPYYGGREVIITGAKGSGKTTLMLRLADALIGTEYVIWRGRTIDQYNRLPNWRERVKIFVHKDMKVKFKKMVIGQDDPEPLRLGNLIVRYSKPLDIIEQLEKDKLNVIYEPKFFQVSEEFADDVLARTGIEIHDFVDSEMKAAFFWFEFDWTLLQEKGGAWVSEFKDEAHQIYPQNAPSLHYWLNQYAMYAMDDFRKQLVSHFLSTHLVTQIDSDIRAKIPFRIYLRGAVVERRQSAMRFKNVTMDLPRGVAKIEEIGGGYGEFRFKPFKDPGYNIVAITEWKGPKPSKVNKMKGTIKEMVSRIFITEGPTAALNYLKQLYKDGEISRAYYYALRSELLGGET